MVTTVGNGKYTYEVNPEWARLPVGWEMPAAAVYGDSHDRVFCFNRNPDHPIVIFDRDGAYLSHWGGGLIAFAHAILIDKEDNVWLVDRENDRVLVFTQDGAHIDAWRTKSCPLGGLAMRLSKPDAQLFFELSTPLHFFVNQQLHLLSDVHSLDDYIACDTQQQLQVRDALYQNIELIDAFIRQNPNDFPDDKLAIIAEWKHFVAGDFYIE